VKRHGPHLRDHTFTILQATVEYSRTEPTKPAARGKFTATILSRCAAGRCREGIAQRLGKNALHRSSCVLRDASRLRRTAPQHEASC
jgi:hypothetical protein